MDDSWKPVFPEISSGTDGAHPVLNVSFEDAQSFCNWLSKKEGKLYRLPTDGEWSQAVGIGAQERRFRGEAPDSLQQKVPDAYPWGTKLPTKKEDQVGNYSEVAWKLQYAKGKTEPWSDGFVVTAPVMSFKPNKLGIYDLGGNVWEVCNDAYSPDMGFRVQRGGSYNDYDLFFLLSAGRRPVAPTIRGDSGGFRCVVEVTDP